MSRKERGVPLLVGGARRVGHTEHRAAGIPMLFGSRSCPDNDPGVAVNNDALALEQKIYDIIQKAGGAGVKHSKLHQTLHRYDQVHINIIIENLARAGKIRIIETATGGRPGKKYVPFHND